MLFYCYSEIGDSTIESRLGEADYSYYFVLKAYQPLLAKLGEVRVIDDLGDTFINACSVEIEKGVDCYLLAFAPPHKIPFDMPCPVIPVFAWEYSSIPNSEFINDPKDSWCYALQHFGQALTHSSYARDVVLHDIGADFPIESIPAPLWDRCEALRNKEQQRSAVKALSLSLQTAVIDSWDFTITSESIAPATTIAKPIGQTTTRAAISSIDLHFGQNNPDVWLVGFYPPEGWGAWSKTTRPWIMLPTVVEGQVKLVVSLNGHGNNIGRDIEISIGDQRVTVNPQVEMKDFEFHLNVTQPSNFITFSGLDTSAQRSIVDPRTIAVGLARIVIESEGQVQTTTQEDDQSAVQSISLNGVVYTSILNPRDGRKNWEDIITAFCIAFREREDAILIFKMTYTDMSGYLEDIFALLCQLHPFKCRVIVIHGFISGSEYNALMDATTYIVNASRSEGQCLPLMEYMSCGVPAIAPDNTAMSDYISRDNAFIVDSSPEPHYWPHDPRQIFTTLWYRPSWESLHKAYLESYEVAMCEPERYAKMSYASNRNLYQFCSMDILLPRLKRLLERVGKKEALS